MIAAEFYNQLLFSVLVIIGVLVTAKVVDTLLPKLIRGLVQNTSTNLDDQVFDLLQKPLFYTVLLVGALLLIDHFAFDFSYQRYIALSFKSLLVLLWSIAGANIAVIIFSTALLAKGDEYVEHAQDLLPFIRSIVRIVILALALFYILQLWEVDITPVLASAGVAGLAVALAAKDSLANFFGGLSLFLDQAYKVGDYVIVDDTERGEVVSIGMRSTRIRTRDNVYLSIPNSVMANSKVVNETGEVTDLRLRIKVGVSYDSNIEKVEKVLYEIAYHHEHVLKEPGPKVRFREFGDSALLFELLVWIHRPTDKGHVTHELNSKIFKRFHQEKIVIPYPQIDVHMPKGVVSEK